MGEKWTPGQLIVMAAAIQRRRAARQAEATTLALLTTAAAMAGGDTLTQVQEIIRKLWAAAGIEEETPEVTQAEDIAAKLGLRFVDHARDDLERPDSGGDDGEPAD